MQNAEASVWRHLHNDDFDQIFSVLLCDYKGNGMESVKLDVEMHMIDKCSKAAYEPRNV